jgi:hypothetical protein
LRTCFLICAIWRCFKGKKISRKNAKAQQKTPACSSGQAKVFRSDVKFVNGYGAAKFIWHHAKNFAGMMRVLADLWG